MIKWALVRGYNSQLCGIWVRSSAATDESQREGAMTPWLTGVALFGALMVTVSSETTSIAQQSTATKSVTVQTSSSAAKPDFAPVSGAADSDRIRLSDGTLLRLALTTAVSSKTAKVGDKVEFLVVDDVKVDDLVVVARKAQAIGMVKEVHPPRRKWKGAVLGIEVSSLSLVDGEQSPLRGTGEAKGAGPGANEMIDATFPLPLFLLERGREVVVPRGTVFTASTKGDAYLDREKVKTSQPQPLPAGKGPATVTFNFSSSRKGIAESGGYSGPAEIWCGTVKLGTLRVGRRHTMSLAPGTYWVRSHQGMFDKKKHVLRFNAEDGGVYYLLVGNFPNGMPGKLELVERVVGELEIEDTLPIAENDRTDISKATQQQLQADLAQ